MFTESRKRKQQDVCDKLSSSMPNTSSWSDFIYSSPSSPSVENASADNAHMLNFDSLFDHPPADPHSGTNSRRHSVAVGEMDYHSFDFSKQDMNVLPASSWDADLQMLLNNAHAESAAEQRPVHRRAMSLRIDDTHHPMSFSQATTGPTFFTPNFLDALVADNQRDFAGGLSMDEGSDAATMVSDMSFMDSNDILSTTGSFLDMSTSELSTNNMTNNNNTNTTNLVTPSSITNEINSMADWLLEQQQTKENTQAQKRQRRMHPDESSLSPISPAQTMGSSMSSMSPSPPITPMQPVSVGFDQQQQQHQQQQQPGQDGEWGLNSLSTLNKPVIQSLKPLVQNYLLQKSHQDRSIPIQGESTVMVLTSKVAQKSYGTEKRFLCPPPTTMLKGTNWWTSNGSDKPNLTEPKKSNTFFHSPPHLLHPPKLTIHISGETIQQTGSLEWQSANGTLIEGASSISANLNNAISGRCVSKQLYINDADEKRKRVEVLAKIQLGNGVPLGTFPSKGIKVISKPSKKRQSVKNMELCIHHGTTISLFNRIRSQTVSTKYLGVSNGSQNGAASNGQANKSSANNGTCFVARTGSWDPFVIWIVDTSRSPDTTNMPRPNQHHPNNPNFPPPPAIALQTPSSTQQHVAIHYNQSVVLQCVTTGLVSPVMVIRKVDKGSMILGGNKMDDLSGKTGGECGDETLGDPVSQLHKVAFQIVQDPTFSHHNKQRYSQRPPIPSETAWRIPQSCHPVTYLACLNDVVGMHKTTSTRHLVNGCRTTPKPVEPVSQNNAWSDLMQATSPGSLFGADDEKPTKTAARRRMSSISSDKRRGSIAERRGSSIGDASGLEGACWTEDVSDAAVWTIVGTDCASYTFWSPETSGTTMTPFPVVSQMTVDESTLSLSGENLTRELEVWFGDIKARTDYKSRDTMTCTIPDTQELMNSPVLEKDEFKCRIPLLFVRGDGVVYRTDQYYAF